MKEGGEESWLGRKDSNLQSPEPESDALPFGHCPAAEAVFQNRLSESTISIGRQPGWII